MLANLRALFGVFVDIILLRRGPEDLPASRLLLGALVLLNIVVYAIAYEIFFAPLLPPGHASSMLGQIISAVLMLLWFRVALQLARKPERFVQTAIAVFFISLLGVVLVPLVAALFPYIFGAAPTAGESAPPPMALMLLADLLSFWLLAMLARVVKSAFEWTWMATIAFVTLSVFGVPLLASALFGGPAAAS